MKSSLQSSLIGVVAFLIGIAVGFGFLRQIHPPNDPFASEPLPNGGGNGVRSASLSLPEPPPTGTEARAAQQIQELAQQLEASEILRLAQLKELEEVRAERERLAHRYHLIFGLGQTDLNDLRAVPPQMVNNHHLQQLFQSFGITRGLELGSAAAAFFNLDSNQTATLKTALDAVRQRIFEDEAASAKVVIDEEDRTVFLIPENPALIESALAELDPQLVALLGAEDAALALPESTRKTLLKRWGQERVVSVEVADDGYLRFQSSHSPPRQATDISGDAPEVNPHEGRAIIESHYSKTVPERYRHLVEVPEDTD